RVRGHHEPDPGHHRGRPGQPARIDGRHPHGGRPAGRQPPLGPRGPRTRRPSGTAVDVLVRPEGLAIAPSPQGRGLVMTTTFLGSVTRLGVLLDEDVMVYVDQSNSAAQIPGGTAAPVTLRERAVMVSDRTSGGTAQLAEA